MTRRLLPTVWALALACLVLGPALGHGFVLTYDMVWVPDLRIDADTLGLGSALPRAVPSDAVVAVLDEVVPGMLLQKLVLLGALTGAGAGSAALVAERSLGARLAVVSLTVWSPYVAERLWLGHWPMLLAYAATPWLALAGRRLADGGRPRWLVLVLLAGSLSASAGLVCGAVLLATSRGRRVGMTVTGVVAANAPWLVAGVVHATAAQAATGFGVFGLRGDALPAPLAALTLGGAWNTSTVPHSRTTWVAWAGLALVVGLAVAGYRRWCRSGAQGDRVAQVALWTVGMVVAVTGWALPGTLDRLAGDVPGLALLRDSSRLLPLCLPLLVSLAAAGADSVRERLRGVPRAMAVLVVTLLPLTVMPDAAWGLSGAIGTARYPAEWTQVRTLLASRDGDVLVLPWSAYRAPSWNGDRPVLDPLPRLLTRPTVFSGDLRVGTTTIPGEDPRAAAAARALAAGTPAARAGELRRLGIGYVVTDRTAGAAPAVAGETVHEGGHLKVQQLEGGPGPGDRFRPGRTARAVVVAAWLAYTGLWLTGIAAILVGVWRRAARVRAEGEGGHIP